MASRRSQPYRKGNQMRLPGAALDAMLRGRTASGFNPADLRRMAQRLSTFPVGVSKRPPRAPRAPRATRPPR